MMRSGNAWWNEDGYGWLGGVRALGGAERRWWQWREELEGTRPRDGGAGWYGKDERERWVG